MRLVGLFVKKSDVIFDDRFKVFSFFCLVGGGVESRALVSSYSQVLDMVEIFVNGYLVFFEEHLLVEIC